MNEKGSALIVTVIIAVVLFAMVGVWWYMKNLTTPATVPQPSSVPMTTQTVSGAADWETYGDTPLGFAFQYPSKFGKPTTSSIPSYGVFSFGALMKMPTTTEHPIVNFAAITFSISPQAATQNVANDLQNFKNGKSLSSPSDCIGTLKVATTTVAGEEAMRIDCSNMKSSLTKGSVGPTAGVDFYHNHQQFSLGVTGDPSSSDILNEIIPNFVLTK